MSKIFDSLTTAEREQQSRIDEAEITGDLTVLGADLRAVAETESVRCEHCREAVWSYGIGMHVCKVGGLRS